MGVVFSVRGVCGFFFKGVEVFFFNIGMLGGVVFWVCLGYVVFL